MSRFDAVVVGGGPNGLVAANVLADKGWSVVVLESQAEVGGAVRSDTSVDPDFVHDTFSAFYPLGAASPHIQRLRLEEHGLVWRHAPAVLGHPLPDGSWAVLSRDVELTAASLDAQHPGDGDAWRALLQDWQWIGPSLIDALMSPMPPLRGGLRMLTRLPRVGGLSYVKAMLEPARTLAETHFGGEGGRLLLAGNAGHADIPLEAAGSGLMALLMSMLGQTVGFPVPEGGAGSLTQAMGRRLESRGGVIRTDTRVVRVHVDRGRATAVTTESGERIEALQAVVADVAAPHLYGGLVPWSDLPSRTREAMRGFELDPGTVKVDWALDAPVPWASAPSHAPGTVHIADSLDQLNMALNQVTAHAVPADPYLLVGQMTTADPTRSPAGTESLWAYTHVPQDVQHDAGDEGIRGVWDHDDAERMADRMQARIEKYAPGFGSTIRARRILTPPELQARNENLVGGAIGGGTAALHQQLFFRPVPGLGRAGTPVGGLFLASASAHPGGGVHGAPGANAARAALAAARVRRVTRLTDH